MTSPKKRVKTVTPNSATVHKRMVYHLGMIFLIPITLTLFGVLFHKLVLSKAVDECPFASIIDPRQAVREARSEREYLLIRAQLGV